MFTTADLRARRRARRIVLRVIGAVGVVTVLLLALVVLVDGRASPALAVSGPSPDGDQYLDCTSADDASTTEAAVQTNTQRGNT